MDKKKKETKLNKKVVWGILLVGVLVVLLLLFRNNNNVKVQFDTDGGSKFNTQFIVKDGKIIKPKKEPVKEGYEFDGWYVDGEEFDFDTPVTEGLIIVAKWKKADEDNKDDNKEVKKYMINFDSDSGSLVPSMKVEEGKKLSKPTNPTKEGYEFISWQLNGKEYDFNTLIKEDITLIANWKKKTVTPNIPTETIKHKVSFDSDGGSSVEYKKVVKGNKVTQPANPTKSGYKFLGWYLDNSMYNFNKGVYDNISLVARWEEVVVIDEYTISSATYEEFSPQIRVYVKKNGTSVSAISVLTGDGKVIGKYHDEAGSILVDKSDYNKISKVKLNDESIRDIKI